MAPLRIQIVYAKSPNEVRNRGAALGSAILTIGRLLEAGGHDVSVNGEPLRTIVPHPPSVDRGISPSFPGRRWIPDRLLDPLRELRLASVHRAILKRARAGGPSDLILEVSSYASEVGMNLARLWRVPLVLLYDAPPVDEYRLLQGRGPLFPGRVRRREERSLSAATRVIVYSRAVRDFLVERTGLPGDRFLLHPNIDFSRFPVPDRAGGSPPECRILFLGSFLPWHDVPLLLRAFDRLRDKGLSATLTLAGDGPERPRVEALVGEMRSRGSVRLTGFLDGEPLTRLKAEARIGVVPGSNWYGTPVKVFEYAAAGMAVVAPDSPALMALAQDGFPIRLFRAGSEEALEEALTGLISSPDACARLGAETRDYVTSRYSFERDVEFYDRLVRDAVSGPSRSASPALREGPATAT